MKTTMILLVTILVVALSGCNLTAAPTTPTTIPAAAPTLEFIQPTATPPQLATSTPIPPMTTEQTVLDRATQVITALKDRDMTVLSGYVSPQSGLRFSPYAVVKTTDQIFPAGKVAGLFSDATLYTWGAFDGTGEPINLTFADYFAKFIYDEDFANAPQVALNHRLGISTTMDNAAEFYPGAMIVEFYIPGVDAAMQGMDWRSLRLVFQEESNTWFLVGIIHDNWTT